MGEKPKKYHVTDDGDVYRINDDGSFTSMGNAEQMTETAVPQRETGSSTSTAPSMTDSPIKPYVNRNRRGVTIGVIICLLLLGGISLRHVLSLPKTSNSADAEGFSNDTVVSSVTAESLDDNETFTSEEQSGSLKIAQQNEAPNVQAYEPQQRHEKTETQQEPEEPVKSSELGADKIHRQETIDINKIYSAVEVQAEFPGGDRARRQWLRDNIRWPRDANGQQLQGEVELNFVIERDGSISNVKVSYSENPELNTAAIRLISSMPKWSPAMVKNQPVRSPMGITLCF